MTTMSFVNKTFDPEDKNVQNALRAVNNKWMMAYYLWRQLPGARFMGTSIKSCTPYQCEISLPYRWRSQNPFRSIYFAAQCSAAELSTGLLAKTCLSYFENMSMLVADMNATFIKKANEDAIFTCAQGQKIINAVEHAYSTGEGTTVQVLSEGRSVNGEKISSFEFTWTFKRRSNTK